MQKLKKEVVKRLLASNVTSAELDLLIWMSHSQADRGNIVGVYYKSACEELGISYQTFYDALYGLQEKNFIMIDKGSYYDWDVLILNNDFSYDGATKEGYLSTGHDIFYNPEFYQLKVKEKLLAMYIIFVTGAAKKKAKTGPGSFHIGTDRFYYDYGKELFNVTKRVFLGYLSSLRKFFSIGIKERQYWITPKKQVHKSEDTLYEGKAPTDKEKYAESIAKAVIRRNRAKYTQKAYKDTADLITQYIGTVGNHIRDLFTKALEKSLYQRNERQGNPYKWDRTLQPAFIHKLLLEELYQAI